MHAKCTERPVYGMTAGNMGNMPGAAEAGDKNLVFHGGRFSYDFRPFRNGEYQFIEECYLDSVMDGEDMKMDAESGTFTLVQ
jgi:hypothetical protein